MVMEYLDLQERRRKNMFMGASCYRTTKSLEFDGTSDWMANLNSFGISTFPIRIYNKVTVSIWVKSTKSSGTPQQTIISRWFPTYGGGLEVNEGGWRWMISDIGTVSRALHFHLCTHWLQGLWVESQSSFPLNTWTHVVMTYDGSGDTSGLKMYWDGVLQPVNVIFNGWSTTAINSNAYSHLLWGVQYTCWIGGVYQGSPVLTYWFEGKMDESSFWRYELNSDEVKLLYNQGKPTSPLHVGLKNNKTVDRYFRMGEKTDGFVWFTLAISWNRMPLAPPATLSNGLWNNPTPDRITEDTPS